MTNTLVTSKALSGDRAKMRDRRTLLLLARGWLKQGNPVVALELLKSAIDSAEAELDQDLRAQILKETGRAMMMQSDWEVSESYYLEAQWLFLNIHNYMGAAECARNRANMHFQQGNYGDAEQLCEKALEFTSTLNDHELRATILNTLAAIKSATGDLREAIKAFKLCLADFRASNNVMRQGYVLLNIGLTQNDLGEHDASIESLNESLAIALSEQDLNLVEICYQNIAKCYMEQKEIGMAKSVIDTARRILPGLNSAALETELNLVDCKIMRMMGDTESAVKLLRKTYKMTVSNKLAALRADVLFEQGVVSRKLGKIDVAVAKFDAAAHQYKEVGIDKGFKEAIQVLEQLGRSTRS
ncbi:MAG: tetratricopeptide repeat protein [Candidatus Zixiibacteriota bacterium]